MYEKHAEDAQGRRRYFLRHLSDEFVESTARLLNSEWPRSLAQRCESLRGLISSNNNSDDCALKIPISLILVEEESRKVMGHASLVSICVLDRDENDQDKSASKNLVFLQSLLVDRDERGKGIGKLLMRLVEDYLIEYRFV